MPIKESIVTVEPATEPITLDEAKDVLEMVGIDDKNNLINALITTTRQHAETFTGRSLITQTRVLNLEYFPRCNTIELPNGKVQSITTVKYRDSDDVEQTLNASDYWTDTSSTIARIVIKNAWPSTKCRPNAVVITYVCGYASAALVPAPIKAAMKLILVHLFEHREDNSPVQMYEMPMNAADLLQPYVTIQDAFY